MTALYGKQQSLGLGEMAAVKNRRQEFDSQYLCQVVHTRTTNSSSGYATHTYGLDICVHACTHTHSYIYMLAHSLVYTQ